MALTRINPKSVLRGHVEKIERGNPFPLREDDEWWLLWDGEEPVAFFVCRFWDDTTYSVIHQAGQVSCWETVFTELQKYAEEQGFETLLTITEPLEEPPAILSVAGKEVREFLLTPTKENENADVPVHMQVLSILNGGDPEFFGSPSLQVP